MRYSRVRPSARVVLALAFLLLGSFILLSCSSNSDEAASPHVDCGKLRVYYEEPYVIVPKDSFYYEKGFDTFLDAYNALFASDEVSYLEPTLLVSGEDESHDFRSISMFAEVDDGALSRRDVKNAVDGFSLPRPEMTDPGFRLVDDIDKGDGESILIYAVYESAYKDAAGEMRVASYFWDDKLVGLGLTYLGAIEGDDRAQEITLSENVLRNVKIIH